MLEGSQTKFFQNQLGRLEVVISYLNWLERLFDECANPSFFCLSNFETFGVKRMYSLKILRKINLLFWLL